MTLICTMLTILNFDWSNTNTVTGIIMVVVLGVLHGFALEYPLQTIATLIIGGENSNKTAACDHLTVILNYNLLATDKDDVLECMENMYTAYVGNLSLNVSAVLVSATNDEELKKYELRVRDTYRNILYDDLYREGLAFARGEYDLVDPIRLKNVWTVYVDIDRSVFVRDYLADICGKYVSKFMVVHRVSRVLKKCGQYQDLMLLSEGELRSYSYCDCNYYGNCAREKGEPLFYASDDVSNICGRKFDYTLVLDSDTCVPRAGVFEMLKVAAAHPERGIIQPSFQYQCTKNDTMFMHLESIRQLNYESIKNAMAVLFGQCHFNGKGLVKNKLYINYVIGRSNKLIERIPVDILSHDIFEGALLKPLYAGSTYLLDAPSYNYLTWNIRERRWNRGNVLLAMYFWKNSFGEPMRWMQRKLHQSKFNMTKVRTESELDFVTFYIAHASLKDMTLKPALLLYIFLQISVQVRYSYWLVIMFCMFVLARFATCKRANYKYVILETMASMLQFTPDALVGCVSICRAMYANLMLFDQWVPQKSVEDKYKNKNPFVSSIEQLWGYSLFAMISTILILVFLEWNTLCSLMLVSLFLFPFYVGFTSLTPELRICKTRKEKLDHMPDVDDGLKDNMFPHHH